MQIDNLVERVEALVAALSRVTDADVPEINLEILARETDEALGKLGNFTPRNLDEALMLSTFFVGLIDKVHDDIDLAKKYARHAAKHLQYLKEQALGRQENVDSHAQL